MNQLTLIEYIYTGNVAITLLSLYFSYTLTAVLYCSSYYFYTFFANDKLKNHIIKDTNLIANILLLVLLSPTSYILFLYLPLVPYLINQSYNIIEDKSIITKYYNTLLKIINQITKQLFDINDILHYLQYFTSFNYITLIVVYLVMLDNNLFELAHEIPLKFSFFCNLSLSFILYHKYNLDYHLNDFIRKLHISFGFLLVFFTDNFIVYNIGMFICLYHIMHYSNQLVLRKRNIIHTYPPNSLQMQ